MGFMAGKKALIVGVASERSIAAGIAAACAREGGEIAFTYQNEKLQSRVEKLSARLGQITDLRVPCEVTSDDEIAAVFENLGKAPAERMIKFWMLLLFGLVLVVLSSELIVRMALTLARNWGVDQSYIGIVIIGVGTSLPELIISIGALVRSRVTLSVGNLVGSNILDVLVPIGIAGLIVPIEFASSLLRLDLPILFALSLLVIVFLRMPAGVRKPQAIVLLLSYSAYLVTKTALI